MELVDLEKGKQLIDLNKETIIETLRRAICEADNLDEFVNEIEQLSVDYEDYNHVMRQLNEALAILSQQLTCTDALTSEVQSRLNTVNGLLEKR